LVKITSQYDNSVTTRSYDNVKRSFQFLFQFRLAIQRPRRMVKYIYSHRVATTHLGPRQNCRQTVCPIATVESIPNITMYLEHKLLILHCATLKSNINTRLSVRISLLKNNNLCKSMMLADTFSSTGIENFSKHIVPHHIDTMPHSSTHNDYL